MNDTQPSRTFDRSYYEDVIRTYGYDRLELETIGFTLGPLNAVDLQQRWLCHHRGDAFVARWRTGSATRVITGIGMSGPPHLGTVAQLLRAITLQEAGLRVEVVLGDLDAYNARKKPLAEVQELAARYRRFVVAMGFDATRGILRLQSESPAVALEAAVLARYATDADFVDAEDQIILDTYRKGGVYREIDFAIKYAMLLMTADITYCRGRDIRNVLVMTGLEEHKYIRLAQRLIAPVDPETHVAGLYSRVLAGLNGYPKMSKSIPRSGIHARLSADEIAELIHAEASKRTVEGLSPVLLMMAMTSRAGAGEMEAARAAWISCPAAWERAVQNYIDYQCSVFAMW